jgi:pimeloyl-ACP methyl ester carboxylesterase
MLKDWPGNTESIYVGTKYGQVHILAIGSKKLPPLLMLHAASMGAHSWAENLHPFTNKYRIYAIDNIGEGNKSKLIDVLKYPNSPKEIADLYAFIANSLKIERSPVLGASNGGFIAQIYAYYYPEKVESLVLFGPMGLTPLTGKNIAMLTIATMYPLQFIRNYVSQWALGKNKYCHDKYGEWFNTIMKGTIPSVARPIPLSVEQKKNMRLPILLFLGTDDPVVGDVKSAEQSALIYPNIEIEILNSGHLIAVEQKDKINFKLIEFFYENIN